MLGRVAAALVVLAVPVLAAAADGPVVRVSRPAAGKLVLEVADNVVTVRKDMSADQSVVTMATRKDRLTVAVRRGIVTVTGAAGVVSFDASTGAGKDEVVAVLQGSEAAARARMLLARVAEGPETFAGQSVLMTRALLEVGSGSTEAVGQHQRWAAERAAVRATRQNQPRVIRASFGAPQRGPGDCWDMYHEEAIRIADDFSDCTDGVKWYEVHKLAGCSLIYAVRSEGAMAWYIACNGGVPFNG
jgi:hypothetical protein